MEIVTGHPKYWNKVVSYRCDSLIPSHKLPCALSVESMNELAMNVDTYTHTHAHTYIRWSDTVDTVMFGQQKDWLEGRGRPYQY